MLKGKSDKVNIRGIVRGNPRPFWPFPTVIW